MKHLFIGAAAIALLTACGGEDDAGEVAQRAGEVAVENTADALDQLANVTLRRGDASEAGAALAAMSLAESGAGRIAFAGSDTDDDGASFSDVIVSIEDDGDEAAQILIGTLELDGLDMVDGAASFSKIAMSDIQLIPSDPDDADEGSLALGSIELLNPSPALAGWVASLSGNGEPAPFPDMESITFDSWSMADMVFNLDDGADKVNFTVDRMQLGGADGKSLAVAGFSGLNMAVTEPGSDPFSLSFGEVAMTGIGEKIVGAMQAGFNSGLSGEMSGMSTIMEQAYNDPMEPGYNSFNIADVAFEMGGVDFNMPAYTSTVQRDGSGKAIGTVTPEYTATLSADPAGGETGAELAGALGMMGYEQVTISGAGKSTMDPDTDTVQFAAADNYFTLDDGFTMRFGGDITGLSEYSRIMSQMDFEAAEAGNADMETMQNAAGALLINGFTLVLQDDSIVDRAFNFYAATSGEDPAAVRQQATGLIAMAPMMAGGSGVDMGLITEFTTPLAAFLEEPGTLTISLDPEQPLSAAMFEDMQDPSAITKDMLGLSVTHE